VSDLTESIVASAKYFVAKMHTDALGGSGGLQFNYNGQGTNWSEVKNSITPDWTQLAENLGPESWGDTLDFYIVVDLSTLTDWDKLISGGGVKIILNWPAGWTDNQFEFVSGYFSRIELTKPADKVVDVANGGKTYGWFTVAVPEME